EKADPNGLQPQSVRRCDVHYGTRLAGQYIHGYHAWIRIYLRYQCSYRILWLGYQARAKRQLCYGDRHCPNLGDVVEDPYSQWCHRSAYSGSTGRIKDQADPSKKAMPYPGMAFFDGLVLLHLIPECAGDQGLIRHFLMRQHKDPTAGIDDTEGCPINQAMVVSARPFVKSDLKAVIIIAAPKVLVPFIHQ